VFLDDIGGSRKGKKMCSQFKTMLVCFFDHCTMTNVESTVLLGSADKIKIRKRPKLWPKWYLHNDNAPAHDA
jgi:hypothetical protein